MQEEQGYWEAASASMEALSEHTCGILVCIGIAGGLSNDIKLGDVCYSGTVIDTVCNGKIRDKDSGGEDVDLAADFLSTPKKFSGPIGFVRVMPEHRDLYEIWQSDAADKLKSLNITPSIEAPPAALAGDIACGLVSESKSYKEKLKKIQRKVLCIETEAGAIFRAAAEQDIPALCVRGISDLADNQKNHLEDETKGKVRKYAAHNAVTFFQIQLHNPYFREAISSRRADDIAPLPQLPFEETKNAISTLQSEALELAESKLRDLSPAYRTKPAGFQLPLPRIKARESLAKNGRSSPIEVRSAVESTKRIALTLPRTFPDRGLSWLIAQDLVYAVINDRQVIPVVIDGVDIRPPRGKLNRLASLDIDQTLQNGGEILFIIDGFNVSSKTNAKFLIEEINRLPNSRFIVLLHEEAAIKDVEDFCESLPADHYDLCEVSFGEMVAYVSRHYAMAPVQAEVIALRLRAIFHKFYLQAHPSYFAGIPQEMLSSLLEANRRAELIQLAVDGFLTFVVAEDPDPARLSRSTRARYLRRLVRTVKIEKINLTRDELISHCQDFFSEFGFPNNAEVFIEGFIDRGILSIEDNRAKISLPFMESYFVALELSENPDLAIIYFDLQDDFFDVLAFDLFSEISADSKMVDMLIRELSTFEIEGCGISVDENVLLDGRILPQYIVRDDQMSVLKRRLETATKAVIDGTGDSEKKQRLLDLAERVNEEVSDQRRDGEDEDEDDLDRLTYGLRVWSMSVVMLGQGAERLNSEQKILLAEKVAKAGSNLLIGWCFELSKVDFSSIKEHLTSNEMIESFNSFKSENNSDLDMKNIVSSLVDMLEMSTLVGPFRRMLNHLQEEARHKILVPPIMNISSDSKIVNLLRGIWIADLDEKLGKSELSSAIKELPQAPFLRFAIATHFLHRVYWSISDRNVRLNLLEAANQLVKPMGRTIPVGDIDRELERQEDSKSGRH